MSLVPVLIKCVIWEGVEGMQMLSLDMETKMGHDVLTWFIVLRNYSVRSQLYTRTVWEVNKTKIYELGCFVGQEKKPNQTKKNKYK